MSGKSLPRPMNYSLSRIPQTQSRAQQFLDVVGGQVTFFERVVELHPDAPRPFAIGDCPAGYQTLVRSRCGIPN